MELEAVRKGSPGSLRELLRVALPLIASSGSVSLMHVVDRIFLTWYSREALASAMPAGLMHWTAMSFAMGMATYANTFVAQYEGAQQKDRVAAAIWQGIYLSIASGAALLLFVPLAPGLFAWIGHEPVVQQMETDYFAIMCGGSFPMILAAVLACFFSGRGQTMVVMWGNLAGVLVNIVLDYGLIFGVGPFPRWGIRGAALATVLANCVIAGMYAWLMLRPSVSRTYSIWANRRFDRDLFSRFVRYGFPNGLQFFIDIAGFSVFILLVGQLGTTQLAATSLAFNLNTLAFVPMLGLGTTVMILVGTRIGEGRPELAVRTTWTAFFLSAVYMFVFAAIYVLFPDAILAPYAANSTPAEFAALREQVVVLLRFVALYSFFDAMAIVFSSAVRGAGDTRFSLIFSFFAGTLVMVLPTWISWRWFTGSLFVSWSACTAYLVVLGLGFLIRFQAGHWKSMRVIEYGEPAAEAPRVGEAGPSLTAPDAAVAAEIEATPQPPAPHAPTPSRAQRQSRADAPHTT